MHLLLRNSICALLALTGCSFSSSVDISVEVVAGRVEFRVLPKNIRGILGFTVSVEGRTVWDISMDYERGTDIVYGELPTRGSITAKQLFPSAGDSPDSILGRKVSVDVHYVYDTWHPNQGFFSRVLSIPPAEPLRRANRRQPPPSI
jgi:hypothetical protein